MRAGRRADRVRLAEGDPGERDGQRGRGPNAAAKALARSCGTLVGQVLSKSGSVLGCGHCHATAGSGINAGPQTTGGDNDVRGAAARGQCGRDRQARRARPRSAVTLSSARLASNATVAGEDSRHPNLA